MNAEDSSDDDGFHPVVGKKRKKLDGAGTDGGNLVKNLLQNNKFGPRSPGQRKQPPIVVRNMGHGKLRVLMKTCCAEPRYKLVSYGLQIICSTPLDFEVVQKHLLNKNVEFYTYKKRSKQPHRVVLRGLPLLKTERVKELLRIVHNLDVLEVHAIKQKGDSTATEETPYLVLFPKGHTNLKKLSEINTID